MIVTTGGGNTTNSFQHVQQKHPVESWRAQKSFEGSIAVVSSKPKMFFNSFSLSIMSLSHESPEISCYYFQLFFLSPGTFSQSVQGFEPATFLSRSPAPPVIYIEAHHNITGFMIVHALLLLLLLLLLLFFPSVMLPPCPASHHRENSVVYFAFFLRMQDLIYSCIFNYRTFPFFVLSDVYIYACILFLSMHKEDKIKDNT